MFKNVAAKFIVFAFDATSNVPKTGDAANITAYVSKDYGTVTVLADTSATEMDATNAPGYYLFDAAQGETNGDCLMVSGKSSTANIKVIGAPAVIYTRPTTGWLAPATAGRTLVVDAAGLADANMVKVGPTGSGTAQTARDVGGALPAAAPQAAGGLITSTAGSLDLDEMNVDIEAIQTSTAGLTFTGAGKVDASVRDWVGDTIPARNTTGVPIVDTKYITGTLQTAADVGSLATEINADADEIITTLGTPAGASIAADLAEIEGETDTLLAGVTVTTNSDKTGYALSAAGSAAMTEGYPTFQGTGTLPQLLYAILQHLEESSIAGTTKTVKKRDATTTAETLTLDSATTPTSISRAT